MRQGQHKSRSRGRNQRRPGGNSSNRVYESNGPDVKVRGTAQTVAEKYLQLARDAVSSGDIVMSESYYQHAEHYMRIIAANQSQKEQLQQQRMQEAVGSGPQPSEQQPADDSKASVESVDAKANGGADATAKSQDSDDAVSFDGDLPQFLKSPPDDEAPAEKPKRTRRTSSRSKAAASGEDAAAGDGSAKSTSSSADDEGSSEPPSDAEAAVG